MEGNTFCQAVVSGVVARYVILDPFRKGHPLTINSESLEITLEPWSTRSPAISILEAFKISIEVVSTLKSPWTMTCTVGLISRDEELSVSWVRPIFEVILRVSRTRTEVPFEQRGRPPQEESQVRLGKRL